MASKSKKRRRVFRASCILAALIIAGSSFAWFTSKDEVTNRLSASADYNVVAIENFSPPKQFVPGQTVKKEEAVTNTGSIDAFVKQTITGALEVTVEVPTTIAPNKANATELAKYVTFEKQNEWGALEAGSMLAWAPSGSANKPGVVIGMGISGSDTVGGTSTGATGDTNDFNPDKTGLYVFRRAVQKDTGTTVDKSKDLTYDYVAYYYVANNDEDPTEGGTYYKIYGLKIDEGNINTDGYLEAGTLAKEPVYTFAKAVTTYANKQEMYYDHSDTANDGNRRLVVVFDGKNTVDNSIVNEALASSKKDIYNEYDKYEDLNLGKTVYEQPDATAGTATAPTPTWDATATGVADYDTYKTMTAEAIAALTNDNKAAISAYKTALATYNTAVWNDNYRDFTTWQTALAADWAANADTNDTGLTTYDIYDKDDTTGNAVPSGDLSNFGLDRLTKLETGTAANLAKAKEGYVVLQRAARDSREEVNEGRDAQVDMEVYLSAVFAAIGQARNPSAVNTDTADAQTNTGPDTDTVMVNNEGGLYLKVKTAPDTTNHTAGTYEWQAFMITDAADPVMTSFYNGTTQKAYNDTIAAADLNDVGNVANTTEHGVVAFDVSDGSMKIADVSTSTTDTVTMTADNINEKRFQDPGETAPSNATWVTGNVAGAGVTWIHVEEPATSGTLQTQWRKLVYHTQRKVLNLKKQELIQRAINNNGGVQTDNGRSLVEAQRQLEALQEELTGIEKNLKDAQTTYNTSVTQVKSLIDKMNTCQEEIDQANAQYNGYLGTNSTQGVTYTMPDNAITGSNTIVNVTAATVPNGMQDSVAEDNFENKLKAIFGDAVLDTACKYTDENGDVDYESDYDCQGDHTATHNKLTNRYTYGFKSTKDKVDSNLVYNYTENADGTFTGDGTVSFKTGEGAAYTASSTPSQNDIKSAPYWKDYITGKMKDFRTKEAQKQYGVYQKMLDDNAMLANQQALATSESEMGSDKVKLYVNLVNVTDKDAPTANNLWQYRGNSNLVLDGTGDIDFESSVAATDFIFGYTGILEAGETSSLLIKSVEFDSATTQEAFKDLKFDINVLVESAQAVYNGPRIESTAAKEGGITLIQPTADDYADAEATVAWTAGGTDTLATYNDPSHKGNTAGEDAYHITAKTYTVTVGTAAAASVATPVELAEPITVTISSTDTVLKYALSVKIGDEYKTYYGASKDDGATTYYALVEGEDGTPTLTEGKGTLSTTADPATVTLNVE